MSGQFLLHLEGIKVTHHQAATKNRRGLICPLAKPVESHPDSLTRTIKAWQETLGVSHVEERNPRYVKSSACLLT
jgi:hypothetical protein